MENKLLKFSRFGEQRVLSGSRGDDFTWRSITVSSSSPYESKHDVVMYSKYSTLHTAQPLESFFPACCALRATGIEPVSAAAVSTPSLSRGE